MDNLNHPIKILKKALFWERYDVKGWTRELETVKMKIKRYPPGGTPREVRVRTTGTFKTIMTRNLISERRSLLLKIRFGEKRILGLLISIEVLEQRIKQRGDLLMGKIPVKNLCPYTKSAYACPMVNEMEMTDEKTETG